MSAHVPERTGDGMQPRMVHRARQPETSEEIRAFLAARRSSEPVRFAKGGAVNPTDPANIPDLADLGEHGDLVALSSGAFVRVPPSIERLDRLDEQIEEARTAVVAKAVAWREARPEPDGALTPFVTAVRDLTTAVDRLGELEAQRAELVGGAR